MLATLAILVPSRGRPHNLARLIDAIRATATGYWQVYTRLDDDDPELDAYRDVIDAWPANLRPHVTTGPRVFYAASLNELAPIAIANGATHLAMFGDDVVPETVGWDRMLIDALGDRLGIAYGDDGLRDKHAPDLPTHYVTQAEVAQRIGWMALPTLRHLYCDDVARQIGKGLDNFQYVDAAKVSHWHRWNRKAPDDLTYQEANDKRKRDIDRRAFEEWRDGDGYREAITALTA